MPVDIIIPQAGESVTSGVISRWLKNTGEFVKRDEDVLEIETDKVTMAIPAPAAGVVKAVVAAGQTVSIGQKVGEIDEKATAPVGVSAASPAPAAAAAAKPAASAPVAAASPAHEDVRATPLAKKVADEHGVDLARITGTGPSGRVREQDVLAFVQAGKSAAPTANGAAAHAAPAASPAPARSGRGVSRERMSPLRQRIAARLVEAQHTAAMLTTFNEVDMTAVMELRKKYKEEFEKKHQIGLGFMGFFVKAAAAALKAFPAVNSYIVDAPGGGLEVQKHDYCDIAIAVSTPKGLVVPVLRDCQSLSLAGVEQGIKELAGKARDGKLSLEDMQGGTFTITNGGIFGSLMSTPILNPPQSAILGMHTIKNRAVEDPAHPGQIALRPMMYLALSYDHRIIDGAEAVQFLVRIKQAIEDPTRLVLEL